MKSVPEVMFVRFFDLKKQKNKQQTKKEPFQILFHFKWSFRAFISLQEYMIQ